MTITEALQDHVFQIAEKLQLPCSFPGEAFITPAGPYLRCSIGSMTNKAAGLGKHGPARIDGSLNLTLETLAGKGLDEASCLAARVSDCFPYGAGLDYAGPEGEGEIIFSAPKIAQPETDSGRVKIHISIGFYAILFPKEK